MIAANMIGQQLRQQAMKKWIVAKTANAPKKIVQAWIAVKMVNVQCRLVKMRVVAKTANVI
jgi:hypothetical protein